MADYKNIPLGLRTQTQIPLDVKEYIQNESLLSNLGVNGQLAYTYTKGLVVYCIEESTRWEWTEVKPGLEDTGLINQDFIYSDNHIAFGIDYSNKRYNFFPYNQSAFTVPDATTTIKGILKLANDLGGTADAPTTPTAVHKTGNETINGIKTFISRVDFQQSGTSSIGLSIGTGATYSQSFTTLLFNKDADGSASFSGMDNTITGALGNISIKSSNFGFATLSTENIPLSQIRNFKLPSASGTLALEQNLQKVITTNVTLSNVDNDYTIFINNGATPITITLDSTVTTSNFCVGFIQEGTGDVSFIGSGVSLTNPIGLKSKGQGYQTFIERKLSTSTYYLLGNTKV